ncbi:AraC family transcriptional regulator [Mycobacterium vulneris]|uniref:AraC family transcriptional regulator n=1 Tax=Mycolicibacterium septicum DSM 44393 TaxID=1341646 RepID=A0A7X6RYT1_9MYCO|nr:MULTISPECIES: AraC family transcriptional regulator [Mycolicibacterium]MBX8685920.1 helix-turn-helix domain-containing protein [Mycobacterium sp. 20091114027_K0903767]MCP3811259.1 AraC family transcriptional regulator [Mycobacteriaceae bacterium Msp059]OCB47933.1 AraC family transcriptional regulator [Mycolicibacterium vulneris]NKZ14903.1 AraC family transcriptional regulator [Mycolicibacterium septicum DSM 44393]OBK07211.1 AraC family transcriptional regulator [Mycolicibacterium fortuitum]
MELDQSGMPALAFLQMLDSDALSRDSVDALRRIMIREHVTESMLVGRDAQVPLRWFTEIYPDFHCDQGTRLGLAFGGQAKLTSFGALSVPLVSAGSVAEVVELLAYLPVITTALSPSFHSTDHGLTIGLTGRTGDVGLNCLAVSYCGLALLRLLDMLAGAVPSVELHLSHSAPAGWAIDGKLLSGRLFFNALTSYIHVPADALHEVCRFPDPVAYRIAVADLQRTLDRQRDASFSEQIRELLEREPAQTSSSHAADELAMSTSTLKRRLSDEGTTFRELRQSFMRERAMVRLLDRSVSISEVAAELGYNDVTNFTHAFKRWTGRSPSYFRRA